MSDNSEIARKLVAKHRARLKDSLPILNAAKGREDFIESITAAYVAWGKFKNEDDAFRQWQDNKEEFLKVLRGQ